MKSLLFLVLVAVNAMAAPALTTNGAYELNRRSSVDRKYSSGTKLYDAQQFGVKGTWDYSVSGGAAGGILPLLDHERRKVTLPAGAIIRDCLIDVVTAVSAGAPTSARFSLDSKSVGDLKADSLIIAGGYTTTQRIACIPVGTTGTMIKTTSELTVNIRIGSEALTAGKLNVWLQYVLSE